MIFHTKGCANEALRRDEFRGIQSCIFLSSVLNYSVKTFCFGVLTGLDNSITIRYFKAQLCKREHFESKMWHCDHNGNSSSVENHFSGTVYSKLKTIAVVTPLHKNICVYVVCISVHAHKCVCVGKCICMWDPESKFGFLLSLSTLCFETESLSELTAHGLC